MSLQLRSILHNERQNTMSIVLFLFTLPHVHSQSIKSKTKRYCQTDCHMLPSVELDYGLHVLVHCIPCANVWSAWEYCKGLPAHVQGIEREPCNVRSKHIIIMMTWVLSVMQSSDHISQIIRFCGNKKSPEKMSRFDWSATCQAVGHSAVKDQTSAMT